MVETTTIGLDVAKRIFRIPGVSADGKVTVKRQLPLRVLGFFGRLAHCIVGLEACGGSHFWVREIRALGYDVRLIPPAYVKPYVKRGKTDAVDAEPYAKRYRGQPCASFQSRRPSAKLP
jgi:transposase